MACIVAYNKATETFRQMPENYLLAQRKDSRWIADPDRASNYTLAEALFSLFFHDYNARYGSPEYVLETLKSKGIAVQE